MREGERERRGEPQKKEKEKRGENVAEDALVQAHVGALALADQRLKLNIALEIRGHDVGAAAHGEDLFF